MTIPTNGRDGAPMPPKPNNPPTSKGGVSQTPTTLNARYEDDPGLYEAGYRQGWRERHIDGQPRYEGLPRPTLAASTRSGKAIGRSEAEAELLDQGWTPPGGVIIGMAESREDLIEAGWTPPGATSVDAHLIEKINSDSDRFWERALMMASHIYPRTNVIGTETGSEIENARKFLALTEWFWNELMIGPRDIETGERQN